MTRAQIDRFFRTLARELGRPARVIVTGAAAGSLWGMVRPSADIDFEIRFVSGPANGPALEAAMERTERLTGIAAHYAEDMDRFGAITLLDYRQHTRPFKKYAGLDVRLLDPAYWAIGKLTRYLDLDVDDLVVVLKAQRPPPARLINVWAKALARSPRSTACTQFCRHVEHFLKTYADTIWGKGFDGSELAERFLSRARAASKR